MSEPLDRRFSRLRRRIRQVVWLHGLSWLIAVVFGAVLIVGLIDWAIHLDDAGVRLLLGLSILAAAGWIVWRRLISPLRRAPDDVDLALRVERRFPGFHDSLASTVQFLEQGIDPARGSPALQQKVIAQTVERTEGLNLSDVIETRGVRRWVAIAVAVCLASALIAGLNQASAGIALTRLVLPFADVAWPRTTDLRLMNDEFQLLTYDSAQPLRLARGDELTLYVENIRGELPGDVRMEYRVSDKEVTLEKPRIITRKDQQGRPREVGVATLVATRGPVWFRAVGGDDRNKPLFKLEVVPPPLVDQLQVNLTPPAYSGQPVERLARGVGHVEGLVGTRVDVVARVNKPLQSAALEVRGRPAQSIALSADGRELTTHFVIGEPGVYSYWFDLKDRQGFENPEAPRYEIRAVADLPPDIQIQRPAVDLRVTAAADVPLRFAARDDLGLKSVRLHYKTGHTQDTSAMPRLLRDGAQQADRPRELTIEQTWALSELKLSPGMRIVFHATASDDYDLGEEHVGRSISRTLTIVTAEEKRAELASRQAELLEELERLVDAQTRARGQVAELVTQLDAVGALRREDVDLLKRIELDQRQISARLLGPIDGFETRARQTRDAIRQNKLDAPDMSARLEQLADEVANLRLNYLPAVEQELTRARKAANTARGLEVETTPDDGAKSDDPATEQPADNSDPASRNSAAETPGAAAGDDPEPAVDQRSALTRAGEGQEAVLESLNIMRDRLAEWRDRHDLLAELDDVLAAQEQVRKDSAEIARQTLGRSGPGSLTPQEAADLAKVAQRQRRQADKLDEFRDTLKSQAADNQSSPFDNREALRDAARFLEDSAISGRMRQAADALQTNDVGQAATGQQQITGDLNELRDILSGQGPPDLEMLVKKLKQAESDLLQLRKRQDELRKQTGQAEQLTDPQERQQALQQLRKQQQALRDEVARLARKLRRLQAQQAADAADRAADRLRRADEQLGNDQPGDAAGQQQEALDDLEQAQRELARKRRAAEEQLARQMMEKMADKLKSMIVLEQSVIDETKRLDEAYQNRGSWSRSLSASVHQVRETQEGLERDTRQLIEALSVSEVLVLALEQAARDMKVAASRLAERQTGAQTVAAEESARRRFVELVAAIAPEEGSGTSLPPGGGGGDPAEGGDNETVAQLAQLKILKSLQESLIRRTVEIDEAARKNGSLSDAQQKQLAEIAEVQGRLADLARNLMQTIAQPIELDDPPGLAPDDPTEER